MKIFILCLLVSTSVFSQDDRIGAFLTDNIIMELNNDIIETINSMNDQSNSITGSSAEFMVNHSIGEAFSDFESLGVSREDAVALISDNRNSPCHGGYSSYLNCDDTIEASHVFRFVDR